MLVGAAVNQHWLHLSIYRPITRAGVQWAASLFCIHGGAEYGFRYVVMEPSQWGVFRSCSVCDEEAIIISRDAHYLSDQKIMDVIMENFLLSAIG